MTALVIFTIYKIDRYSVYAVLNSFEERIYLGGPIYIGPRMSANTVSVGSPQILFGGVSLL
jgi:hypothetical protein